MGCLEDLGSSFSKARMDVRAVRSAPGDLVIKTDHGVVTSDTRFAPGRNLGRQYKDWTKRNGIPYISKGNNPALYERAFLNTLNRSDFVGLSEVSGKGQVAAAEAHGINTTKEAVLKTLKEAGVKEISGVPVETFVEQVGVERRTPGMLASDVTKSVWEKSSIKEVRKLTGGAQRTVALAEDSAGNRFVTKEGSGASAEVLYYNVADELGVNIVPKTAWRGAAADEIVQQEFVASKVATNHTVDPHIVSSGLRKFVLETKSGRDWNFLDYVFDQQDRNRGNFAFNLVNGKVKEFRLIDNNSIGLLSEAKPDFGIALSLPKSTVANLTNWLKSLGWTGDAASWQAVENNVFKYFTRSGVPDYDMPRQTSKAFVTRLRSVVDNGFKVPLAQSVDGNIARSSYQTMLDEIKKGDALIDRGE